MESRKSVCVCVLVAGRRVPLSGVAGTGFGGSETESAACLSARSLQREAQQPAATRPALPHPMHGEYTPLPWQNSDLLYAHFELHFNFIVCDLHFYNQKI